MVLHFLNNMMDHDDEVYFSGQMHQEDKRVTIQVSVDYHLESNAATSTML